MHEIALVPHARLPRAHHDRHVLASTVDAFGAAHWLLAERAPEAGDDADPYDALVVSVADGAVETTELSGVRARWPKLDRLPDGRFVVASARSDGDGDTGQVQIFNTLGREYGAFSVGDAIEHLLVDEVGDLWAGHFDENPLGIRRWSAAGELLWASEDDPGAGWIMDCYALNVSGTAVWACPYVDFPLLEIRPGQDVRSRTGIVGGADSLAVHGERVAFLDHGRIVYGEMTGSSVERRHVALLTRPEGGPVGRRRVAARGSRVYVGYGPLTEWGVFDLGA
ncbi:MULTISPECIES: hypothetical protein [unclassified Streptomyces]|uniref:hypothetical protein n=1 Tax=unclassified Streptomyces TaxID=2593676 RepID=UPI0006AE1D31|nr:MULTISPECIES: hypothetical protein [unclassified Streptomyces]